MTHDPDLFCLDTMILTEAGEVRVQDLAMADLVVTIRAEGPASCRVAATGRRHIDLMRHPCPALASPVRIQADAFAPGMPSRDLRLSPHHAVYLDGHLFEANALCNGITIFQEPAVQSVTYVQLVLETHDVLLAEGLPVGSSLGGSGNVVALHPDLRRRGTAALCLNLVTAGQLLAETRRMLEYRAVRKASKRSLF